MRRTYQASYNPAVHSSDVPITRQFFCKFLTYRRRHVAAYDWFYSDVARDAAVGLSSALPINPIQIWHGLTATGGLDCSFSFAWLA